MAEPVTNERLLREIAILNSRVDALVRMVTKIEKSISGNARTLQARTHHGGFSQLDIGGSSHGKRK